ncbi:MAG: branched-chain amino acid ABC transporter permease [Bacillota bacterium]|nr:branched-chain amino acid ABC transporter permease [Bacillota bacterium]
MYRDTRNRVAIGALVFLAVLGLFIRHTYLLFVMCVICINAILVLSLNFILGFAGQVFMGTVGFFAFSTYVTALTMTKLHWNWWIAMGASILATMVLSLVVGLPSLRVSGFHLSIMSTGFITVVSDVLRNWAPVTGGVFGVMGIERPSVLGYKLTHNLSYFLLAYLMLCFMTWLAIKIEDSRFGRAFKAVRDDELATELLGISSTYAKMLAFVIAGFYTGIAGSLFGSLHGFVSPETFTPNYNTLFMSMLVVGGLSTVPGAVAGSILLTSLTEVLRPLREKYLTAYGLFIILIMRYEPGGILAMGRTLLSKFRRTSKNLPGTGGEVGARTAVR